MVKCPLKKNENVKQKSTKSDEVKKSKRGRKVKYPE
jgi:hypothetical protein